jgi:hypothetical protein
MDSTKSRPTEKTSPRKETVAGGAMRNSQPCRLSDINSRARALPEKTNHELSDLADGDRNCTADNRHPDEERSGVNKRKAEKEIREKRDSRLPDRNRCNFRVT